VFSDIASKERWLAAPESARVTVFEAYWAQDEPHNTMKMLECLEVRCASIQMSSIEITLSWSGGGLLNIWTGDDAERIKWQRY